jgi:hypothetical protein
VKLTNRVGEIIMSSKQSTHLSPAAPLRLAVETAADETTAQMVEILQEHLALVREGKLRSLAVVSVSQDGASIGTQWSCGQGDSASLIGKLTVLTHDLMASRE